MSTYAAPDRMVHMRIKNKAGEEQGIGLTLAQWQTIRKSPVVSHSSLLGVTKNLRYEWHVSCH